MPYELCVRAFLGSGLGNSQFRRGIGFQTLVRYHRTAADGSAVGAAVNPLECAIEGCESVTKSSSDCVVDALFGQRLRRVGNVAGFPFGGTIVGLRRADIAEQSLHLRTLRSE
jgi:hypothetical protein